MKGNRYQFQTFIVQRVNQPYDPRRWEFEFPPHVASGYVDPETLCIAIPASNFQPQAYLLPSKKWPTSLRRAYNYGAMGAIIGREFTHLFDAQGRMYDDNGQIFNWSNEENQTFDAFTSEIIQQYEQCEMFGAHINGKLTKNENTTDIGGLSIAHNALLRTELGVENGKDVEQCFFMAWTQSFRFQSTKESTLRWMSAVHYPYRCILSCI